MKIKGVLGVEEDWAGIALQVVDFDVDIAADGPAERLLLRIDPLDMN